MQLNTTVPLAVWLPDLSLYELTLVDTRTGVTRVGRANFVIVGVGALCEPQLPVIPGRDAFGGLTWHSARWNHGVDITGKDVAVIGTGCSAAQIVPAIAPLVKTLTVYQRTPAWVLPRFDAPYSFFVKLLFRCVPLPLAPGF